MIDAMTDQICEYNPDLILGIEARGFIFAPALAYNLGAGFVPVRKPKKLPGGVRADHATTSSTEQTRWRSTRIAIQSPGVRVIIADDLLATGGTAAAAAIKLV